MSKVWLSGESSLIGRNFTDFCNLTNRHIFVNSLENDEYDYWRKTNLSKINEIDVFDPTLETIISRSGAEIIVHTVELTESKRSDVVIKTNIMGTYYMCEIAKNLNIPLIYISSQDCYKQSEDLLNEKTEIENNSIYSYSKNSAESLIKMYLDKYTIIVPGYLYGPKDNSSFIHGLISSHLGKVEEVEMNINPELEKSFLYIDDFISALDEIIRNNEMYNKSKLNVNGSHNTFSNVIEMLQEQGLSPEYDFNDRHDVIGTRKLKSSKINTWKPIVSLEKGIEKTVDWAMSLDNR